MPQHELSGNAVERATYMARIQPPPSVERGNRSQAAEKAQGWNQRVRHEIQEWAATRHLEGHMKVLPSNLLFSLLFVEADEVAGRLLSEAPYVVEVARADEIAVDLLRSV